MIGAEAFLDIVEKRREEDELYFGCSKQGEGRLAFGHSHELGLL